MGKLKAWFFKWLDRYRSGEEKWYTDRQRTQKQVSGKTSSEMEEIIKLTRQNLYNEDVFCGAQAIHWELTELGVPELPSLRTINRIISRNDLTTVNQMLILMLQKVGILSQFILCIFLFTYNFT